MQPSQAATGASLHTPAANNLAGYIRSISECMASADAFTPQRLLDQYRAAHEKEAFVAALIGQLLVTAARLTVSALGGATVQIQSRRSAPSVGQPGGAQ